MCGLGSAIERGWENVGNWVVTHGGEHGLFNTFNDFSSADESDEVHKPETQLDKLNGQDYPKRGINVPDDDFGNYTMDQAHADWDPASKDIAPNFVHIWKEISQHIASAKTAFNSALNGLNSEENPWTGATYDAAMANLSASFPEVDAISKGADAMSVLVDAFSRTIATSRSDVMGKYDAYRGDLASYPDYEDEIKSDYAPIVQKIMREGYTPYVRDVASKNPGFTTGKTNQVTNVPPGNAPGVTGPGTSNPQTRSGSGVPTKPTYTGPTNKPTSTDKPKTDTPSTPEIPQIPTDAMSAATDAAKDAASQATDAAKDALGQALDAAKGNATPASPPEGVLGLGPNGLRDALTKAAANGSRGATSGAGQSPTTAKPPSSPSSAVKANTTGTSTAPRASISSGSSGSPGAGAPAAGQRGGANEKEYKANKALRRKKNGESVVGDTNAVVAVVGDEPKSTESVNPGPA